MNRIYTAVLWVCGSLLCIVLGTGCGSSTSGSSGTTPSPVTVTISGSSQVRLGSTAQFSATVSGVSNSSVTWQINNITGGNSTVGTISNSGIYTPPTSIPTSNSVTVSAISTASPTSSASATISILNPLPTISSASCTGYGGDGVSYLIDVKGSGFINSSAMAVNGTAVQINYLSATELTAVYTASAASLDTVTVAVTNPDPGSSSSSTGVQLQQATATAAVRFLEQSSFGPTLDTVAMVRKVGLKAYLNQQFAATASTMSYLPATAPTICQSNLYLCSDSEWWDIAINGGDQLRQRVAFALSQIFVVSTMNMNGYAVPGYINTLSADAFTNYRTIMQDVTTSPAMGTMLNMVNNAKSSGATNANENYAREFLQLFTIGVNMLNSDGSYKLDSNGQKIPTYTQAQVQGMAKAFTGWTYSKSDGTAPTAFTYTAVPTTWQYPMAPIESMHDASSKTILGNTSINGGQTAAQDLAQVMDTVFQHENVGPFVCKQLIQHLVTSTPSANYIARVSAVFADNGSGVRGDMKSVISAILLDSEARSNDDTSATADGGHLREPILYITNIMRGLGYTSTFSDPSGSYAYSSLTTSISQMSQTPVRAPSVFNFFSPDYVIPKVLVNAPEFGIESSATIMTRMNVMDTLIANKYSYVVPNLSSTSSWAQLASSSPQSLVDTLGMLFLQGKMPSAMNTAIVNYITSATTDPAQRARLAAYLVLTSPQYKVMK